MKFHVTDLDALLWYRRIEGMPLEDIRGRLLRTKEPNEQMKMGTAWHSILENPPDEIDTIEKDGFTFKVECDCHLLLPQIREIRAEKDYPIDNYTVALTGGTDGITANLVTDHKLTFKPNPETYFDSYQWRAYLDIFGADVFQYYIYSARQDRKTGEIVIYDISPMSMYRYPEMVEDLTSGIRDLVGFCKEWVPELWKQS